MLIISQFASECKTTVKTIRFYDNIGLLKADYVSLETGYRYYRKSAVMDYFRITALKDAGFSLDEIREQVYMLSDDDVIKMLAEKANYYEKQQNLCTALKNDYIEKVEKQKMAQTRNYSVQTDEHLPKITISSRDDTFSFSVDREHIRQVAEMIDYTLNVPHFICLEYEELKDALSDRELFLCFPYYNRKCSPDIFEQIIFPSAFAQAKRVVAIVRFSPDVEAEPAIGMLDSLITIFDDEKDLVFDADFEADEEGANFVFWGIK